MKFVSFRIAAKFLQPPFATVRGNRAILAAFVPMPEAAVDEDGGFVFWQNDVRNDEAAAGGEGD